MTPDTLRPDHPPLDTPPVQYLNLDPSLYVRDDVWQQEHAGARFGVYDVMRTGAGELSYPLPWAGTADTNAIAAPEQYRDALSAAGFEILSERQRRDVALDYFARQRAQAATGPAALGVQTLMGARRPQMVRNMSESICSRPNCAGRDYCPKAVITCVRSSTASGGKT